MQTLGLHGYTKVCLASRTAVTHLFAHHPSVYTAQVQRGRGGLQRSPWQAVRGDGGRDTERDEVRASRMGGKQDQEYNGGSCNFIQIINGSFWKYVCVNCFM